MYRPVAYDQSHTKFVEDVDEMDGDRERKSEKEVKETSEVPALLNVWC